MRAYYGTENGVDSISSFLRKYQVKCSSSDDYSPLCSSSDLVHCKIKLTEFADKKIIRKAMRLWKKTSLKIKEGQCLFIRKYSMPKAYIFPNGMLGKGDNFVNLFILRDEL